MVRFSDLLGGGDDPEAARPAPVSTPAVTPAEIAPESEAEPEPEPEPEDDPTPTPTSVASPADVLDRLTQYATSARAGDQVPDVREPAAVAPGETATREEAAEAFTAIGDDLLPRSGPGRKSGRGRKRRP